MRLSELKTGEYGVIVKVLGHGGFRKRIVEMGFIKGKVVEVLLNAPLQDPVKYKIMGYEVSLRHNEAEMIEIISPEEAKLLEKENSEPDFNKPEISTENEGGATQLTDKQLHDAAMKNAVPSTWRWWATPTAERRRCSTLPREPTSAWATTRA